MVWQFKKIIPLSFATIFGFSIIFLAVKENYPAKKEVSGDTANESWRDSLTITPSTSPDLFSFKKQNVTKSGTSTASLPPTTTEALARDLLLEYVTTKRALGQVAMTDADAQVAAERLVQKIKLPQGKQYSAKDIVISSNNSTLAIKTYADEIRASLLAFSASTVSGDIEVVYMSPKTDNAKRQSAYRHTMMRYDKLIKELLASNTPSSIASLHLRLVQAYANREHSVKTMMEIFTDPIKGFAALTEYRKEVVGLTALGKEYERYLAKRE